MNLRFQLYLLKVPKFESQGLPTAFTSLPKAFDREAFAQAQAVEQIDEPILVAQSEVSEEIMAIEATLSKHGCSCLNVDAGSDFKRAIEQLKARFTAGRERQKRLSELMKHREARESDAPHEAREKGRTLSTRQLLIIAGVLGGLVVIVLGVVLARALSGSGEAEIDAGPTVEVPTQPNRFVAQAGVSREAIAGLRSSTALGRFLREGLLELYDRSPEVRQRTHVPGTGPVARYVAQIRDRFDEEITRHQDAGSPAVAEGRLLPFAESGSGLSGEWGTAASALAARLVACGEQEAEATLPGAVAWWALRPTEACSAEPGEACLAGIAELGCDTLRLRMQEVHDTRAQWARGLRARVAACLEEEDVPMTDAVMLGVAFEADRLSGHIASVAFERGAPVVVRIEAFAEVDCDDLPERVGGAPAQVVAHFLQEPSP